MQKVLKNIQIVYKKYSKNMQKVFKKYSNPLQLSERGIKLTAMLDNEVGYEAPILAEMPEDEEIIVN